MEWWRTMASLGLASASSLCSTTDTADLARTSDVLLAIDVTDFVRENVSVPSRLLPLLPPIEPEDLVRARGPGDLLLLVVVLLAADGADTLLLLPTDVVDLPRTSVSWLLLLRAVAEELDSRLVASRTLESRLFAPAEPEGDPDAADPAERLGRSGFLSQPNSRSRSMMFDSSGVGAACGASPSMLVSSAVESAVKSAS